MNENISVLIIDQSLDHKGFLANHSFVLGLSAGRVMNDSLFGPEVQDKDGVIHMPLTNIGHMVKVASQGKIKELYKEFKLLNQCNVVDYTDASLTPIYSEYQEKLSTQDLREFTIRAMHVFGPKELVFPKTKNLDMLK